jgi:hypothetical protein
VLPILLPTTTLRLDARRVVAAAWLIHSLEVDFARISRDKIDCSGLENGGVGTLIQAKGFNTGLEICLASRA